MSSENRPHILLVEDDYDTNTMMAFTLRQYKTSVATSVTAAKDILNNETVDLILLDLSLEGVEDGLDLVRFIRRSQSLAYIPVVAVTAHAFKIDKANVMAAGCNAYFAKPVKMSEIQAAVNQHLHGKKPGNI